MARFLKTIIFLLFLIALLTVEAKPHKRKNGHKVEPYGKIPESRPDTPSDDKKSNDDEKTPLFGELFGVRQHVKL